MFVGVLSVELHICQSGSLKSKRQVIRCLKDRIRSRFNAAVSEVDHQDKWQRALVGVACISDDKQFLNGMLSRISDFIREYTQTDIIDMHMEIW